jgi:hypothetical protein
VYKRQVFICIFITLANPKNIMVKRVKFHLRASEADYGFFATAVCA